MISLKQTKKSLDRFGMLKHFPTKPDVVAEVGRMLDELCQNDSEAERLTAAVLDEFSEWPGPKAIRDLFRSTVASRRPAFTLTPCSLCVPALPGFRMTLQVQDEHMKVIEIIKPSDPLEFMRVRSELQERYRRTRNAVYEIATFCECAAGEQRGEWERQRVQGRAR